MMDGMRMNGLLKEQEECRAKGRREQAHFCRFCGIVAMSELDLDGVVGVDRTFCNVMGI